MDLWTAQLRGYKDDADKKTSHISTRKAFPKNLSRKTLAKAPPASSHMNKDLNRCAQLLTQLLDNGDCDLPKGKPKQPTLTVNKLKNKPNVANAAKSRKVKKRMAHPATGTRPGLPARNETASIGDELRSQYQRKDETTQVEIDLAKEEIIIPETETLRGIHRTVHIPTVLNEADEDAAGNLKFDATKHPLEPFKPVPVTLNGESVGAMDNKPRHVPTSRQQTVPDPLQNPLMPFRPAGLPSYPAISGLPNPVASSSTAAPNHPAAPSTPYNRRLPSSTPNMTPTKIAGTAQIRVTGPSGSQALNSTDEIKAVHPPTPQNPGPKLTEGVVEFQPRPQYLHQNPGNKMVAKEILDPSHRGIGNFSLYSDTRSSRNDIDVPTRDTDHPPYYLHPHHMMQTTPQASQQQYLASSAAAAAALRQPSIPVNTPLKYPPTPAQIANNTNPATFTSSSVTPAQNTYPGSAPQVVTQTYAHVQPTTIPQTVATPTPYIPPTSSTDSAKPVPQETGHALKSGDQHTHTENFEETEDNSLDPKDQQPNSVPAMATSSRKSKDKVKWSDKALSSQPNSKKAEHKRKREKRNNGKTSNVKVGTRSKSVDAEVQTSKTSPKESTETDEEDALLDTLPAAKTRDNNALKESLQKLQRLTKDLKAASASKGTVKIKRLVRELGDALKQVMPGGGELSWQTELDLALQPLRSENATLRRRLRLQAQELREKELELQQTQKPDPTVHTIHLEMLSQKLEKELEDQRLVNEQQHQQLRVAQEEIDNLVRGKQQMLEVLGHKDNDHLKSQQDWLSEVHKLRADLEAAKKEGSKKDKEKEEVADEKNLLEVAVREKEMEIDRLQDLVKNLQESMSRLVQDLQTSRPYPLQTVGRISDGLQRIEDLLDEDADATPRPLADSDVNPLYTSPSYPPTAKKSLNFDPVLPRQPLSQGQNGTHQDYLTATKSYQYQDPEPAKVSATSEDLDVTDYFFPPGASPFGHKLLHRDSDVLANQKPGQLKMQDQDGGMSGGPTVKELLSSFTERMRASLDLSMTLNERKRDSGESIVPVLDLEKLDEESELSGGELSSMTEESTLTEDKGMEPETEAAPELTDTVEYDNNYSVDALQDTHITGNMSRYSVTDYFKKYPQENSKGGRYLHSASAGALRNVEDHREFEDDISDLPSRNHNARQGTLYRGTVLDTSLSTINPADMASVGTGSTTSVTSATSLDDRVFREGLARLDADIAKIQLTLRHTSS